MASDSAVLDAVLEVSGVSRGEVLSDSRRHQVVKARQVGMYLTRKLTGMSYPAIARFYRRDHTTVVHACRKIERLRSGSPDVEEFVRLAHKAFYAARV